jgi:diguanylate cyclase (GGDEF)-like protein/PAS domain S-box-containing protein
MNFLLMVAGGGTAAGSSNISSPGYSTRTIQIRRGTEVPNMSFKRNQILRSLKRRADDQGISVHEIAKRAGLDTALNIGKRLPVGTWSIIGPVLVALVVYGTARISVDLSGFTANVATIWLPNGIVLAVLLLTARRKWPAYIVALAVGNLAMDLLYGDSALLSLGFTACNAAGLVLAATLLCRAHADDAFGSVRSCLLFVVLAAGISTAVGATLGAGIMSYALGASYFKVWLSWWLGDVLGILLVTPWILAAYRFGPHLRLSTPAFAEILIIAALMLLLAHFGFSDLAEFSPVGDFFLFAILACAIWATLSFDAIGCTSANIAMGMAAMISVIANFAKSTDEDVLLNYLHSTQTIVSLLAVMSLLFLAARIAVQLERNRARLYLDMAGAILVVLDLDSRIVLLNRRGGEILGVPKWDAIGKNWFDTFSPPEEREAQRASYSAFLSGKRGPGEDIEDTVLTAGGEIRLISWHDTLLRDDEGRIGGKIASGEDITIRRELESQLEELATRDELTGAYNRRYFMAQAQAEILRALRYRRRLAFMFLDLDHFKSINDRFGHATGDKVLKAFSRLAQETFRPTELFARIGGEEFVVMLPETGLEQAAVSARRLMKAMRHLEISANPPLRGLTSSIGITEFQGEGDSLESILQRIDKAVYQAKANGRDRIETSSSIVPQSSSGSLSSTKPGQLAHR